MLRQWIGSLLHVDFASPLDPRVWECSPLVILNEAGDIEFAEACTVEFSPTGRTKPYGFARILTGSPECESRVLNVELIRRREIDTLRYAWVNLSIPNGLILNGTEMGQEFTWYINGPALEVLDGQIVRPELDARLFK